jgi:hypothetical protein
MENFNPDSLYAILEHVKPDVILYELDSSFFDEDFSFNRELSSNEFIATTRYVENHGITVRPYDFTGRNEHRIKIGSRPTDGNVHRLLDSLLSNGLMPANHHSTYSSFNQINDSLIARAYGTAESFNNVKTDSISQLRQQLQYEALNDVVRAIPLFSEMYHLLPSGDSITYLEGYERAADFWHLRNQTMATNILKFIDVYNGKTIVVLNGFFHRYYLNLELRPLQESMRFQIHEFYNYKK